MSGEGLVRVDREDIATEYDLLPGYRPCPIGGGPEERDHPKKTSRRFFIPDHHRHGEQIPDIKHCVVVSWIPSSRSPFVSFLSPPLFFPFYSQSRIDLRPPPSLLSSPQGQYPPPSPIRFEC